MKVKLALLLVAALAFGIAVPALASAKSKPKSFQAELKALGISCPAGSVELQGTFGGAGGGFLALTVSKAAGQASSLKGKQVSLRVLASTKVFRNGPTVVAKLKKNSHLSVVALMCSQGLVARSITAK